MNHNLNYGQAIEALKQGKMVARNGWNGKGMFIFMRPADDLPIGILLGAKSLPNGVKDYYELKHQPIIPGEEPKIKFTAYLCMKAADDTVVNGWLASQTDMLAEDWEIFNPHQSLPGETLLAKDLDWEQMEKKNIRPFNPPKPAGDYPVG